MQRPSNKRERYHLKISHATKPWQIKREKTTPKLKLTKHKNTVFDPVFDVYVDGNHVGQLFREV
jgi:hypothetical protein